MLRSFWVPVHDGLLVCSHADVTGILPSCSSTIRPLRRWKNPGIYLDLALSFFRSFYGIRLVHSNATIDPVNLPPDIFISLASFSEGSLHRESMLSGRTKAYTSLTFLKTRYSSIKATRDQETDISRLRGSLQTPVSRAGSSLQDFRPLPSPLARLYTSALLYRHQPSRSSHSLILVNMAQTTIQKARYVSQEGVEQIWDPNPLGFEIIYPCDWKNKTAAAISSPLGFNFSLFLSGYAAASCVWLCCHCLETRGGDNTVDLTSSAVCKACEDGVCFNCAQIFRDKQRRGKERRSRSRLPMPDWSLCSRTSVPTSKSYVARTHLHFNS